MADVDERIKQIQRASRGEEVRDAIVAIFKKLQADFTDVASKKQDILTFDQTPTEGSSNPVTSDGIKKALGESGGNANLTFDDTPTEGSSNPVTSDGIKKALSDAGVSMTFDDYPKKGSKNPVTSDGIRTALNSVSHSSSDGVVLEMTFDPGKGYFTHTSSFGGYDSIFAMIQNSEDRHKKLDVVYEETDEELGTDVKIKLYVAECFDDRYVLVNIPYEGVLVRVVINSKSKFSRSVKQIKTEVSDEYYS